MNLRLMLCLTIFSILLASNINFAQTPKDVQKELVNFTFNDQVVGTVPKAWKMIWGDIGQDQKLIDNIHPMHDQSNYMLLKRSEIDNAKKAPSWGAGAKIPKWKSPWLEVRIDFRHYGPFMARAGRVELTGLRGESIYAINLGTYSPGQAANSVGKVYLRSEGEKPNFISIGKVNENQWYRLCLRLPSPSNQEQDIFCKLLKQNANGNWEIVGNVIKGFASSNIYPVQTIRMSMPSGKVSREYTIALDNIRVLSAEQGQFD